jgi:hypothetical protein
MSDVVPALDGFREGAKRAVGMAVVKVVVTPLGRVLVMMLKEVEVVKGVLEVPVLVGALAGVLVGLVGVLLSGELVWLGGVVAEVDTVGTVEDCFGVGVSGGAEDGVGGVEVGGVEVGGVEVGGVEVGGGVSVGGSVDEVDGGDSEKVEVVDEPVVAVEPLPVGVGKSRGFRAPDSADHSPIGVLQSNSPSTMEDLALPEC